MLSIRVNRASIRDVNGAGGPVDYNGKILAACLLHDKKAHLEY